MRYISQAAVMKMLYVVTLGIIVGLAGCDSSSNDNLDVLTQSEYVRRSQMPPDGIWAVECGGLSSGDTEDWQVAPMFFDCLHDGLLSCATVSITPPCPNPVALGQDAFMAVGVHKTGAGAGIGRLSVTDASGRVLAAKEVNDAPASIYSLKISTSEIGSAGLWRIFVRTDKNYLVTYGDLEIVKTMSDG